MFKILFCDPWSEVKSIVHKIIARFFSQHLSLALQFAPQSMQVSVNVIFLPGPDTTETSGTIETLILEIAWLIWLTELR